MPHRTRFSCAAFVAALVVFLTGCERPFIDPEPPSIDLAEGTDLSVIREEPELPLAFRASAAFGAVQRIDVNGAQLAYDAEEDLYRTTLTLDPGLNQLFVEAFGEEGTSRADTLYALYLPVQFSNLLNEPALGAVGGHAATPLLDGRVLVTGGAPSAAAEAHAAAYLFDPATFAFTPLADSLTTARTGHTATRLPDGRVLIAGGTRRLPVMDVGDLVSSVELFDPATETFDPVPIEGDYDGAVVPVQRTDHTTTVLDPGRADTLAVYFYGGTGNLGLPSSPSLGASPFMRRFWLIDGPSGTRLVAPDRSEGFRFAAVSGHTQTPLTSVGDDGFGRYLVAGLGRSPGDPEVPPPFELLFDPARLNAVATGTMLTPRTEHGATLLQSGLTLLLGGRTDDGTSLATGEVYADEAGVFFRFADRHRLAVARRGHTVTNLGQARILVVGGFSASGSAIPLVEILTAPSDFGRSL